MRTLRKILSETRGAEIAETAAVLPVLFSVLLAIFFFGRAYNIYGTITQAAQQGARAAVAPVPAGSQATVAPQATDPHWHAVGFRAVTCAGLRWEARSAGPT